MLWFFLFIGLLIFAPTLLMFLGIVAATIAMPFMMFFAVWGVTIWLFSIYAEHLIWLGILVGFIAGIIAARAIVARALDSPRS